MSLSLYDVTVPSFLQTLGGVSGFLEKGAAHFKSNNVDPDKFVKPLRKRIENQQVRLRTVTQTEMQTSDAIESLTSFIGIVGLVALLLGGIGVASGVRAFVARKIDTVAVLRCLGASSGQVRR